MCCVYLHVHCMKLPNMITLTKLTKILRMVPLPIRLNKTKFILIRSDSEISKRNIHTTQWRQIALGPTRNMCIFRSLDYSTHTALQTWNNRNSYNHLILQALYCTGSRCRSDVIITCIPSGPFMDTIQLLIRIDTIDLKKPPLTPRNICKHIFRPGYVFSIWINPIGPPSLSRNQRFLIAFRFGE